jgi:predicted nucleotidyltransferase
MGIQGREWIRQLPAGLAGQRAFLERLLTLCEADDDVAWLLIGCSLARGAADSLSDLDVAVGVRDDRFTDATHDFRGAMESLGNLIDSYHHQIPGVVTPHERIFAQYSDRCQLDLVIFAAEASGGSFPGAVVLYDLGDRIAGPGEREPVTPEQIREWAFRAWCALADLGKYLRRDSRWEALEQLHQARSQLWQLIAAASGVPDPQYGLTSILDFAPGALPAEMAGTVADLDPARLLAAARRLAALLSQAGERLHDDQRAALPLAMARYITDDLASLDLASPLARRHGRDDRAQVQ